MDYKETIAFTDMNSVTQDEILEPYKDFEYIYKFYPDSYYILNTRSVDNWIQSRLRHSALSIRYRMALNLETERSVIDFWLKEWFSHHREVLSFFWGADNFLLFDIEKDQPGKIANFLNKDFAFANEMWKVYNKTS